MDPLRDVDLGAYYFFRFQANHHPQLVPVLQGIDALAGYVAAAVLLLLAVLTFCLRGRPRAGVAAVLVAVVGAAVIESLRHLIARRRPDDAQDLLGAAAMLGSYPAGGVFLFTMTLLLFASALGIGAPRGNRVALGLVAALLIVGVCLAELMLGLHYVTDVVGGMLGGSACAILTWSLAARPIPETAATGTAGQKGTGSGAA